MTAVPTATSLVRTWICILGVAALAISGECLIAAAMRSLGDLDHLRTGPGLRGYLGPIRAVLSSPLFSSEPSAWRSTSSPCSSPSP